MYFGIMWWRMYEVIKSRHVFPSFAGLLIHLVHNWNILNTPMHMWCTCVLACSNKKFVTVLCLLPIPRITSIYNLYRCHVWSHTALYKLFFSFMVLVWRMTQLRETTLVLTLQLLGGLETFLGHRWCYGSFRSALGCFVIGICSCQTTCEPRGLVTC